MYCISCLYGYGYVAITNTEKLCTHIDCFHAFANFFDLSLVLHKFPFNAFNDSFFVEQSGL